MNVCNGMDKIAFRRHVRALMRSQSRYDMKLWSQCVVDGLVGCSWFREAQRIACFYSLWDEVYLIDFINCWLSQKEIYLPVITNMEGGEMVLRRLNRHVPMVANCFDILEPSDGVYADRDGIDLFIVPGMAFDRSMHRLGRGKGFYDRLLPSFSAKRIGVCFDFQFFDSIPFDDRDVVMDAVFTPSGCFYRAF